MSHGEHQLLDTGGLGACFQVRDLTTDTFPRGDEIGMVIFLYLNFQREAAFFSAIGFGKVGPLNFPLPK